MLWGGRDGKGLAAWPGWLGGCCELGRRRRARNPGGRTSRRGWERHIRRWRHRNVGRTCGASFTGSAVTGFTWAIVNPATFQALPLSASSEFRGRTLTLTLRAMERLGVVVPSPGRGRGYTPPCAAGTGRAEQRGVHILAGDGRAT